MASKFFADASKTTSNWTWRVLVVALICLIAGAYLGAFILTADANKETDPAAFVTLGTAGLTGLLGLFTPSPKTLGTTDPTPKQSV
ncbi:hypothetical protein [Curtobacterium flaccumfaciens]|uniref:hypothetical protein n=1 Tax=Curtobacterium flaccumfaciens TaxID=2035 RepID=UPI001BDE54C7|nr:hypothetical protein [Curtobacterium flaccumfaciens]MBT1633113.1 hypothetical protein [Curtobacterium flaccumfaciens pv. oortii]MCX2843548.1 hypothetical protein [Curtobacterium flaccumfaciens pv. oortii]